MIRITVLPTNFTSGGDGTMEKSCAIDLRVASSSLAVQLSIFPQK